MVESMRYATHIKLYLMITEGTRLLNVCNNGLTSVEDSPICTFRFEMVGIDPREKNQVNFS